MGGKVASYLAKCWPFALSWKYWVASGLQSLQSLAWWFSHGMQVAAQERKREHLEAGVRFSAGVWLWPRPLLQSRGKTQYATVTQAACHSEIPQSQLFTHLSALPFLPALRGGCGIQAASNVKRKSHHPLVLQLINQWWLFTLWIILLRALFLPVMPIMHWRSSSKTGTKGLSVGFYCKVIRLSCWHGGVCESASNATGSAARLSDFQEEKYFSCFP